MTKTRYELLAFIGMWDGADFLLARRIRIRKPGNEKKKIEFIEKQLFLQQNDNEMAILFRKLIFSNGQVPVALATPHRVESRVVKAEKTFMTKPF